ncbi:MAG: chromosomal replication initiator protein DnaA [Clostridia bacterium]|nr:chromosomal replication initiator protein DnaA [Clostridia bacterium]MBP5592850.1 chromosomal replication initiator protein DnaA [Clostridia bacterium]MBP5649028.1 chromosomal replication initiator protein DnaA [Clostridia bacterium]
MRSAREIWKDMLNVLETECSTVSYDVFIYPLEPYCIDKDRLILIASSANIKENVNSRLKITIKQTMRQIEPFLSDVLIIEEDEKANYACELESEKPLYNPDSDQYAKSSPINPRYNFEEFVVGDCNRMVVAAAHAISENPGKKYNPLFIYGGVGLGKTHIVHAIANDLFINRPDLRVAYISSEKFLNDFISSMGKGKEPAEEFRNSYRSVDVLMIDDVQFFSKKGRTQEELFHTFNYLHEQGKQLVFTSDRAPNEIPDIDDRLRSRFGWGLIADIQKPDVETRIAILEKKALARCETIPVSVLSFMAEKMDSNIRELEGLLNKVIFLAELTQKPYSIEIAADALKDFGVSQDSKITTDHIVDCVCKYFGISRNDLFGKKRNKEIVEPRQICMYLISDLTSIPQETIGSICGGRDHSTVIHACAKIERMIASSTGMKTTVDDIRNLIYRQ